MIQFSEINMLKNQIIIQKGNSNAYEFSIPLPNIHRHKIKLTKFTPENLLTILKKHINPAVINGLRTEESILGEIQKLYSLHFNNVNILFTRILTEDVTVENKQEDIIKQEHNRAHRNSKENKEQIMRKYFYPKLKQKIQNFTKHCRVSIEKYDRHQR